MQEQAVLPSGWRWESLGQLCRQDRIIIESGSQAAARRPYLGLEDIESNSGKILKKHSDVAIEEGISTTFAFGPDHVLFGKLRPYLNKVALPDYEGRCTTEIIPLLPADGVDRRYLAWLLRRQETVAEAMREKTGSRMPRADIDELLKLIMPLPPLSEQSRIATVLNEQMPVIEKPLRKADRVPCLDGPFLHLEYHQLLVDNNVTAFFHGHDHLFARQELNGVVYQACPQPGATNDKNSAAAYTAIRTAS